MIFFGNFFTSITGIDNIEWGKMFEMLIRSLFYWIDQIVYEFLIDLYNLFRTLCEARINDGAAMSELATRIGLILGLVMFFYVTFDFIQILIDPGKLQDKEKGPINIIKKFIIVVVLLGTSSFIFDYLYDIQKAILSGGDTKTSVIEKLILPYDTSDIETSNFGNTIAANFMMEFYKLTSDEGAKDAEPVEGDEGFTYGVCKKNAENLPAQIASYGSLSDGTFCLNARYETDDGSRFYIDFNPLSAVVGIVVVWMILMYCISVGMRVIQLAFLEIISPMAIVSYLSPKKDSMFSKFWRIYFATYIDVFIRIAIIDFVVLLSALILNLDRGSFWTSVGRPTGSTRFWLSVFMVIALLSFARKAPDLIKQFLPDKVASGLSFGLGTKDRAGLGMIGGTLAGAATGLIGGGLTGARSGSGVFGKLAGAAGGIVGGAAGGVGRGFSAGFKGKNLREAVSNANKNQTSANINYGQRLSAGGSPFVLPGAQMRLNFLENEYADAEDYSKSFGTAKSKADSEVDKHLGNYMVTKFMAGDSSKPFNMTLAQLQQAITNTDDYDDKTRAEMQLVYNNAHTAARNLAMNDRGAVNEGTATIDFGGNNYSYSATAKGDIGYGVDHNVEIDAHMKKVLRSSHATGVTDYEKAKNANSYYEQKVADKLNDKTYKRRSANVKYGNKK